MRIYLSVSILINVTVMIFFSVILIINTFTGDLNQSITGDLKIININQSKKLGPKIPGKQLQMTCDYITIIKTKQKQTNK